MSYVLSDVQEVPTVTLSREFILRQIEGWNNILTLVEVGSDEVTVAETMITDFFEADMPAPSVSLANDGYDN